MLSSVLSGEQLWPLLLSLVVLGWAVAIAYCKPVGMVGVALGTFVFETVFGPPPGFDLGGTLIYPRDGVFVAMMISAAVRVVAQPRFDRRPDWASWALVLLSVLSLLRGIHEFGADRAGNDFRGVFYILAGVAFLATHRFDARLVRDVVDLWIGVALVLVVVGVARTIGWRVGLGIDQQPYLNGRPLYAWPTLFIGQAAILSFFAESLGSRWSRIRGLPHALSFLFLLAVLIFRHRTVWITMVVCLAAMWTFLRPDRSQAPGRIGRWSAGLLAGAAVLVLLAVGGGVETLGSDLARSAESATSEQSTFSWRLEGWKYLLDDQGTSGPRIIVGRPYGSGYQRKVFGAVVNFSPHSWYVQTITRVGVLGLACLLGALWRLFNRGRSAALLPRNLGALIVLSSAVYGIAYQPPETLGVLLGLVALSCRGAGGTAMSRSDGTVTARTAGSESPVEPVPAG